VSSMTLARRKPRRSCALLILLSLSLSGSVLRRVLVRLRSGARTRARRASRIPNGSRRATMRLPRSGRRYTSGAKSSGSRFLPRILANAGPMPFDRHASLPASSSDRARRSNVSTSRSCAECHRERASRHRFRRAEVLARSHNRRAGPEARMLQEEVAHSVLRLGRPSSVDYDRSSPWMTTRSRAYRRVFSGPARPR
jgi:hypothetical protein